jgi:YesN/AraC family two-component response regulator
MSLKERIESMLTTLEKEIEEAKDKKERIKLIWRYDSLLSKLIQLQRLDERKERRKKLKKVDVYWNETEKIGTTEAIDD